MASAMDVDDEEVEMASSSSGKGDKKRFEVKKVRCSVTLTHFDAITLYYILKQLLIDLWFSYYSVCSQWNAVALWAWGML